MDQPASGSVLGRWPGDEAPPPAAGAADGAAVARAASRCRSDPAGFAALLDNVAAQCSGGVLQLSGWQRAVRVAEGAACFAAAARALRAAPPLPPLRLCGGLARAAACMAQRAAAAGDPGATGALLATAREHAAPAGVISLNSSCGWFVTGEEVVAVWAASDGDPDREHRDNILRAEVTAVGAGTARDAAGRLYAVCIFADYSGEHPAPGAPLPPGVADAAWAEAALTSLDGLRRTPGDWAARVRTCGGALESGAAQVEAAAELSRASPLPPLRRSTALSRAAADLAHELAARGCVHAPAGASLSARAAAAAALRGRCGGAVTPCVLVCAPGGDAAECVASWAVNDGDFGRQQRRGLLAAAGTTVGAARCVAQDGREWCVLLTATGYEDAPQGGGDVGAPPRDVAEALVAAFDGDGDGAISLGEYVDLADRIGLPLEPDPPSAFARAAAAHPHASGGLDAEGLRALAGEVLEQAAGAALDVAAARRAAAAAATTSTAVCAEKLAAGGATASVTADLAGVCSRLRSLWEAKEGDVVDELIQNLSCPDATGDGKLLTLAEAANGLNRRCGAAYGGRMNLTELLVMALYTMAGPDIDALMAYPGVPVYDEGCKAQWEEYCARFSPDRNGAIFSAVNWAMRAAPQDAAGSGEAWAAVRKWVKYIALLLALCSGSRCDPGTLSRGLAGLPEAVVSAHRALGPGGSLDWPAPSSCATDPSVAEAYIRGAAANATKQSGGQVFFSVRGVHAGLPLQAISKYPKEAEVLLSPLTRFAVAERSQRPDLPDGCVVLRVEWRGADAPPDFLAAVRADAAEAARRLAARSLRMREEQERIRGAMRGTAGPGVDPTSYRPGDRVLVLRSSGEWQPAVVSRIDLDRRCVVVTWADGRAWEGTPTDGQWVQGKERKWNAQRGEWELVEASREKAVPFSAALTTLRAEGASRGTRVSEDAPVSPRHQDPARAGSFGAGPNSFGESRPSPRAAGSASRRAAPAAGRGPAPGSSGSRSPPSGSPRGGSGRAAPPPAGSSPRHAPPVPPRGGAVGRASPPGSSGPLPARSPPGPRQQGSPPPGTPARLAEAWDSL